MREVRGFFGKLFLTDSMLGAPRVEGTLLRISVSGLQLLKGHPLQGEGSGPYKGELVFEGVVDSRRTVTEYIGDPKNPQGFKAPYEAVDEIPDSAATELVEEFGFEGFQEATNAWVDNWVVRARAFTLRVF